MSLKRALAFVVLIPAFAAMGLLYLFTKIRLMNWAGDVWQMRKT